MQVRTLLLLIAITYSFLSVSVECKSLAIAYENGEVMHSRQKREPTSAAIRRLLQDLINMAGDGAKIPLWGIWDAATDLLVPFGLSIG